MSKDYIYKMSYQVEIDDTPSEIITSDPEELFQNFTVIWTGKLSVFQDDKLIDNKDFVATSDKMMWKLINRYFFEQGIEL